MTYLKIVVLPIISASSLSLLFAYHDPVKNLADLLHSGAQNCHKRPLHIQYFHEAVEKAINEVTMRQAIEAFTHKDDDGQNAIFRAQSIGHKTNNTDCLEYAAMLGEMVPIYYVGDGNPETKNLKYSEIIEKINSDPRFN